jgi:hypothetical protein
MITENDGTWWVIDRSRTPKCADGESVEAEWRVALVLASGTLTPGYG